ncbi:MAG: hypothetical protein ACTJGR_04970, partial [Pauljensenia sp.]
APGAWESAPVGMPDGDQRMSRTELLGPPGEVGDRDDAGVDPDGGGTRAGGADGDRAGQDGGDATMLLPSAATEVMGGVAGRGVPGGASGEEGAEGGSVTATTQMPNSPAGSGSSWGTDEGDAATMSVPRTVVDSGHLSGGTAPTAQMPVQQRGDEGDPPSSVWSGPAATEELPHVRPSTEWGGQPGPGIPAQGVAGIPGPVAQQSPAGWAPGVQGAPPGWDPETGGPSPYWYPVDPYVWRHPLPVPVLGPVLLLGLAALPVVLGSTGSVAVGVVLLLLATIGHTHARRELRRVRHQGVRSSDTAVALAGLPLHLLRSLLAVAGGLFAGGLVAGGTWAMTRGSLGGEPADLAWPLRVLSAPGVNNWQSDGSPSALLLPVWGLVVLALLVAWALPTSRRLREGTALVLRTVLPPRWSRAALGALVVVVLTATWYILTGGAI